MKALDGAWMSGEEKLKGTLAAGQYADLVVLPPDYFSMAAEQIKNLESSLTIVNGKVVYATREFKQYAPALPEVEPDWSPVKYYGGYQNPARR